MNIKKLATIVVIVFLGFWLFTDPTGMADATRGAGVKGMDLSEQLFTSLIAFFDRLS